MTRRDPIETAKAILEGKSSMSEMDDKKMKAETVAMKEAMIKELSDNDVSEEDVSCLRDVESEAHARRIEQFGKGLKDRDRLSDREAIRARRLAARLGGQHEVDVLVVEKGFRGWLARWLD